MAKKQWMVDIAANSSYALVASLAVWSGMQLTAIGMIALLALRASLQSYETELIRQFADGWQRRYDELVSAAKAYVEKP